MADGQPTDAYRCGQLYAALAALERIGAPNGKVSLDDKETRSKAAANPRTELKGPLERVVAHLMRAQQARKGPEAAALFRSIPDLLPRSKELPVGLGRVERDDFYQGLCAQEKALEAAAK
ncbi:hypothetical protein [Streptomyces sp. NPDC019224]|uniref:hypothetical protein n=1 Tax=Streptomyces sp. NPDC019224 TaxID=3154484 RepID=UPI0033D9A6EE